MILICDESGSKGFSDNKEKKPGEFGVFAGFMITNDQIEKVEKDLNNLFSQFKPTDEKFHITDLEQSTQQELREVTFKYLLENEIPCIYEAISVQGFNNSYEFFNDLKEEQKKKLNEKFSFSNNSKKERLHSELFLGLFTKALAFHIEQFGENKIEITVITDNIEDSLKQKFEIKANELINLTQGSDTIKAFDKKNKKPVSREIQYSSEELDNDNISKTKLDIQVADNCLTLVADIIANSINYYINQEIEKDPDINLNSSDAIRSIPIRELFYGLSNDDKSNSVSDTFYNRNK